MLYSVILELRAANSATLPATMGHQAHALFLDLIQRIDPALSARLHDEPGYRPFTVSPLSGGMVRGNTVVLRAGQPCRLRLTLLDNGELWQCLSSRILENNSLLLRLGVAEFSLDRVLSSDSADSSGWAGFTDWHTLVNTLPSRHLTFRFATPTSFSMGNRNFALFPEPVLVWESLLRVWNSYAPSALAIGRSTLSSYVKDNVIVSDYELQTATLHFPHFLQKGFVGTCTYLIKSEDPQIFSLAAFARYSGVGYKTTMGMGQARLE